MDTESLVVETSGGVRSLRLNRPDRLNALDVDLRYALVGALEQAGKDENVRAVILTGTGERAFCAGQDLHESQGLGGDEGERWMASWTAYFDAYVNCPKPIICAINGVAAGAGFETTLLCDIRLAAPHARFIMAEVDVGLPAVFGGYLVNLHLRRSRTTEIVLTGKTTPAEEAGRLGLVREIVPAEQLADRAMALARELADKPPVAMGLNVKMFRGWVRTEMQDVRAAAVKLQSEAVASGQPQEAMRRFFDRRRKAG